MTKYILCLLAIALLFSSQAKAQDSEEDEYFNIKKNKKYAKVFEDKNITFQTEKWYVGFEVGGRTPSFKLDNYLNGLLADNISGDAQLGGYIGYQHQNKWMAEIGLSKYNFGYGLIVSTFPLGRYYFLSKQLTVPIRFKYKILTIGKVIKQSGLFLGAGLVNLMPVNAESLGGFNSKIISLGRGTRDSISLKNNTSFAGKFRTMLEASAELNIYASKRIDFSIFGRYQLGFSPIVQSEMQYTFNNQPTVFFQAKTLGSGFNYGFCIKYNYSVKQNYEREGE